MMWLKSFVVRLGGFHTQMSFLGSIGHLMGGSGLQELFELVYAENTVNHMLSGKAIARAIRAHFLVAAALNSVLLAKAYDFPVPHLTEDDQPNSAAEESFSQNDDLKEAQGLLKGLLEGSSETLDDVLSSECVTRIAQRINQMKDAMADQRTAKLWIQYLDMVKILQLFIKAERSGNWELHLDATRKMLPYFAAAGHSLYAKSAYLYLQQMEGLPRSHPEVHKKFVEGFHVIRRSDRYWADLSTDLLIEQVLMRNIKTSGGLTRGRGMDEIQRLVWTLSMPACAEIKFAMQELAGIRYGTSDQHREATSARKEQDVRDTWKILAFLQTYDPFTEDPSIHSISSGVTGDKKVNVDKANYIGEAVIASMLGKNVHEYTFKRKDQAITLGSKTSLSKDEAVETDPQLLFQRLCVLSTNESSTQQQQEHFQYELCGHPPALFDSLGLLREANKPVLADAMWELTSPVQSSPQSPDPQYVLDGGALQRLPWQRGHTFEEICDHYHRYVTSRYEKACIVVDGYETGASIKDATHRRRAGGSVGVNVSLTPKMVVKLRKEVFLANKQNKQMFINLLGKTLEEAGCKVVHASGDADILIVKTALESAQIGETVLIGDDTDLLVLLCYHANTDDGYNVFFKPEPKANAKSSKVWNIQETRKSLGDLFCSNILFIHALLGCDSTSRVHGIGKAAALRKVMNNRNFLKLAEVFGKDSSAEEITEAGEKALVCLYNGNDGENINNLRLRRFKEKVAKSSKYVEAKSLPPTTAATKFHSLRVYFQIQEWKGRNQLKPEEWGWKLLDGILQPIKTDLPPGPANLLEMIRCNCTTGCSTARCSCRKHGIDCSNLCGDCKGIHCTNSPQPDLDDNEVTLD